LFGEAGVDKVPRRTQRQTEALQDMWDTEEPADKDIETVLSSKLEETMCEEEMKRKVHQRW
jgi:hypothetical protein